MVVSIQAGSKKMKRILIFIFLFVASNAWATPGVDVLTALKQYYVLLKQLKELKRQVTQADQMLNQGRRAVRDVEGHYGFGQLLDNDSNFQQRNWGFDSWNESLSALAGGNSARYRELLKEYQEEHPTLSERQFSKGASPSLTRSYKNLVNNNRAATVYSNYESEQIKSHLAYVHQLTQKIESAPNTKAAMDLNSRLIAELSYISVEELRMQTLMNHQLAAQVSDVIDGKSREARFNKLPKEK